MALLVACAAACSPESSGPTAAWRPSPVEKVAAPGWAGLVTGILRSAGDAGEALSRVRVELCQADSMVTDTVTNHAGAFTLRGAGLGPGCFLRAALPGGGHFYQAFEPGGECVDLGVVTAGDLRRLEGLAVREGGKPIGGAALTLSVVQGDRGLRVTTRSDSEGRFRFEVGLRGPAVLKCSGGGASDRPVRVPEAAWEDGAAPWVASYPGVGTITVEVVDSDGTLLEDVRVRLEPAASTEPAELPRPIFFPTGTARAARVEQTNIWGVAIFRQIDDVPWDAQLFDGSDLVGSASGLRIAETQQRIVIPVRATKPR